MWYRIRPYDSKFVFQNCFSYKEEASPPQFEGKLWMFTAAWRSVGINPVQMTL